ncbi:kinase-like domain-containing protein [Trichoderma velutinum]
MDRTCKPGVSRCTSCVHGPTSDASLGQYSSSGRYNNSRSASCSYDALNHPFAQGTFRWVAKGSYTSGPRQGRACVVKWFKSGAVFADTYFTHDIKAVDKSLEIVDKFNQLNIIDKAIKVKIPQVCMGGEAMQALSHFSYHITGGYYVLCDLQGGIYQRETVLSDPVILSRNRDYGVTDLGSAGIGSFFKQHHCGAYCRPEWTKPANPILHYTPVRGTTMVRHTVPTRPSRPRVTGFFG